MPPRWHRAAGRARSGAMMDASPLPVLVIGASQEARQLARSLPGARLRLPATGRAVPGAPPAATGPIDAEWLGGQGVVAVIEAAHPFDTETAHAAARAARGLGLPHLQLVRPPWRPGAGAFWHRLRHAGEAARVLPRGARLFAATGREDLAALRRLPVATYLRVVSDDRAGRLGRVAFVPGRPPFDLGSEMRLFRALGIEALLLRNAGGPGAEPKLRAAERLGLRVAMIDRPARPAGPRAASVKEALRWLQTLTPSAA
ncbi:precorrin-6A/cobalt-precorrin-6A reductase [Roseivivax sp. CAU 1761]